MRGFFSPLKIFVLGNILLLLTFPFFPSIGTAAENLETASVAYPGVFWGWDWIVSVGVIKWSVYLVLEGFILFATFKAFWNQKTD